jgi:hypothetical protein
MQLFGSQNIWNTAIDALPTLPSSEAIIAAMAVGVSAFLRCDDTLPLNVCQNPPMQSVGGLSVPQSDAGLYGIPANPVIENGSDLHCLVIDTAGQMLYEFFSFTGAPGSYSAGSAAKWDLNSNAMRAIDPAEGETTSADAAGLPMSPGVVQYADLAAGIQHCLRMTSTPTLNGAFQWPATHYAGSGTSGPLMGQRIRLQASFDLTPFTGQALAILTALKKYGAMIADNGLSFAMQHDQDPRWDATDLLQLHNVPGTALEAVDVSSLMVSESYMLAATSIPASLLALDRLGRATPVVLADHLWLSGGSIGVSVKGL